MNKENRQCAECGNVVARHFRWNAKLKKADKKSKVFYHYLCAESKKKKGQK